MKVILDSKLIHAIPLIECYLESKENKPMIFFIHGYRSNKEEGAYSYIIDLAKHGFFVVSIDAFMHGERIEEPFINGTDKEVEKYFFEVVFRTGQDIKTLYDNHYSYSYPNVSVMGESMGGCVAYYMPTIMDNLSGIIPILGVPSFEAFVKDKYIVSNELLRELREKDPIHKTDCFEELKILMINGSKDDIMPSIYAKELYKLFNEFGINREAQFLSYEGGHFTTNGMRKDIFSWCVENLL